ncbi:putative trans-zeatin O-beta-D-glucosyltransferase [Helianthus annuus]|nr:putative trans-zeatin O-beta-D-glucosyltransferase [Helianthus annuus]
MVAHKNKVVVVMVPLPLQGHINQLLHLSRLISTHNVPVHFIGTAIHASRAKLRLQGWNPNTISTIFFHDLPIPPFSSPPPNPNSTTSFHLIFNRYVKLPPISAALSPPSSVNSPPPPTVLLLSMIPSWAPLFKTLFLSQTLNLTLFIVFRLSPSRYTLLRRLENKSEILLNLMSLRKMSLGLKVASLPSSRSSLRLNTGMQNSARPDI